MFTRHVAALRFFVLASAVVMLSSLWLMAAEPAPPDMPTAALEDAIDPLIKKHEGDVGVMVRHLATGATYTHHPDDVMPTASLIKFPVMLTAYQLVAAGKLDLQKPVTYREEDKVPGSGILGLQFTPGVSFPLRDAVRLMMAYSDNIATNLVLKELELPTTNVQMEAWDCPNTKVHAFVFRGSTSIAPERSKKYGLGSTTAREMVRLLERLHRGECGSEEQTKQMLDHMRAIESNARLAKFLPDGAKVAMKTGSVNAVRTVAGIVETPNGPFAICVLTNNNKDQRWTDDNAGQVLSAEIAREAYRIFNPKPASPTTPVLDGPLKVGSQGQLVEDLQRTLNARLEPSPKLTLDGEFGEVTQAALKVFQKSAGLEETGVTDEKTWIALGPLVAPSEPNTPAEPPARQPADELKGLPFVTAKAWCVGDVASRMVAHSHHLDERRDFASTTKLMTAYIILKQAESNPAVLDEIVTFSTIADDTPGSTAGVRTGEKVTVQELLYGLMLPSGNDAATAFGEHFGAKLPESEGQETTPAARFVALMNSTAAELKMASTKYANPHGLTHTDHKSTVGDQFQLACAALQLPALRTVINTRQYRSIVDGPTGYKREIIWKNTNRLLDIEGYSGVKTGTTDAAGACLISLSERNGAEAVAVVLGATSSDARYTDTRNIFRYYWQNR